MFTALSQDSLCLNLEQSLSILQEHKGRNASHKAVCHLVVVHLVRPQIHKIHTRFCQKSTVLESHSGIEFRQAVQEVLLALSVRAHRQVVIKVKH